VDISRCEKAFKGVETLGPFGLEGSWRHPPGAAYDDIDQIKKQIQVVSSKRLQQSVQPWGEETSLKGGKQLVLHDPDSQRGRDQRKTS